MKNLKVTGASASFGTGHVKLTAAQASTRKHALEHVGDDVYKILSPVQFKHGEELAFDGELNKHLVASLDEVEAPAADPLAGKTKEELLEYALSAFGVRIDGRIGMEKLLTRLQQLEQQASDKAARITELQGKGDELTEAEAEELEKLLAEENA